MPKIPPAGDRCPRRYCGTRLVITTDGAGKVVATCPACERNARGLCCDCPAPLEKKRARRCPRCTEKVAKARDRAYYHRNRDEVLARQKRHQAKPEVRARRLAYMAEYNRQYNDELRRLYNREYMRRYYHSEKGKAARRRANDRWEQRNRERVKAKRRLYYLQHREELLAKDRERRAQKRRERAA